MIGKILLWFIVIGFLLLMLFGLIDGIVIKLSKDHPFRKWWERHICVNWDDYPDN